MKIDVFEWRAPRANPWLCFANAPGAPPPPPAAPPGVPAPPAATPPAEPPAPPPAAGGEVIQLTSAQLKERLDREFATRMRALGVDPEQAKKDAEEVARLRKEADDRKKAEMTELDRLKAEKAEVEAKMAAAERAAAAATEQAAITRLCAEHGVKDVTYAEFRLRSIPEAERAGKLGEWLEDPLEQARFGTSTPTPPAAQPAQTTTTTPSTGAPAPASSATPGAATAPSKPVDEMTTDEYAAYRRSKHGF